MHLLKRALVLIAIPALSLSSAPVVFHPGSAGVRAMAPWTPLSVEDAELLAYLTPFADSIRRGGPGAAEGHGLNVTVVHETPGRWAQLPFQVFDVVRNPPFASPPGGGGGMEVHEHVAVNMDTAQVWDYVLTVREKSAELAGAQEIMRRAHRMGAGVLARYGALRPIVR